MKNPVCEETIVIVNAGRERCERTPGHTDSHMTHLRWKGGAALYRLEVYW